jgi:hypothetical protein
MAGVEPNSPSGQEPPPAAASQVSSDFVAGDKNVTYTAGGDLVLGDKITNISNIYQAPSWGEVVYQRSRQAMIQNVRNITK